MTDDLVHAHNPPLLPGNPVSYMASLGLSLPIAAVSWFEVVYLYFGMTGEDTPGTFSTLSGLACFGVPFLFSLYRSHRPAQVVRRVCLLGVFVSALLPVVAIVVLLLWQTPGRPDLGMGGLMLYSVPYVAIAAAVVLTLLFIAIFKLAGKRLQNT